MFKLPAELTIVQVEECKSQFIEFINENEKITLDDSNVSRIDTVGLQLLVTAVTYIANQKKQLIWRNQSSIISQGVKSLGINEPILNRYLNF